MYIDTHCHLNFRKSSESEILTDVEVEQTITRARKAGVSQIIVPGTTLESSQRAVELAQKFSEIYAAVGIHPHHASFYRDVSLEKIQGYTSIEKTVAIGEVGIDKHQYSITQYSSYQVDKVFLEKQTQLFKLQINLVKDCNKALIVHNREAVEETLLTLSDCWDNKMAWKTVFHCCEANEKLLQYGLEKKIFFGIDGDLSWSKKKQRFIREVPINLLVLETDAPFLLPLELREKELVNEPKNISLIAELVAKIKEIGVEEVEKRTTENAERLFDL
jgi:TatD DNase family protein